MFSAVLYFYLPTKTFKIKTPANPTTETIVSISDHERMVSLMERLKYSLNIQKPASFTWENIRLPAPMARTIRLGSTPVLLITGNTMPAAVKPATVADPTQTRMIAAINQPSTRGLMERPC